MVGGYQHHPGCRALGHYARAYLSRILNEHASISADMALRLSVLLGTSADMWLNMQSAYDLWQAAQKPRPNVVPLAQAA